MADIRHSIKHPNQIKMLNSNWNTNAHAKEKENESDLHFFFLLQEKNEPCVIHLMHGNADFDFSVRREKLQPKKKKTVSSST